MDPPLSTTVCPRACVAAQKGNQLHLTPLYSTRLQTLEDRCHLLILGGEASPSPQKLTTNPVRGKVMVTWLGEVMGEQTKSGATSRISPLLLAVSVLLSK
jgi:hypothetical protein